MRGFVCLQQRLVSCPDRHFTKKKKIQKIYSSLIKSIYSLKLVFQRIHKEKRVYVSILKASLVIQVSNTEVSTGTKKIILK